MMAAITHLIHSNTGHFCFLFSKPLSLMHVTSGILARLMLGPSGVLITSRFRAFHHQSADYDDILSLHGILETLQAFSKLRSLTLSDIDFDLSNGSVHIFPLSPLSSLTFEDLIVNTLQEFFDATSVQ